MTWIEHVQVDDKSLTHRMYRDLVCSGQAYGAKRWISTLKRMCERFAFSTGQITRPKHELEGGIKILLMFPPITMGLIIDAWLKLFFFFSLSFIQLLVHLKGKET